MKPSSETSLIPPALVAQIEAAADEEHRTAADVIRDALERYLVQMHGRTNPTPAPRRSPAEAAARMRARRIGNILPEGVSIRDLMTHGRA